MGELTKQEKIELLTSQIIYEKEFIKYYSVDFPEHQLVILAKIKIELYERELNRLESEEE
jgi:hypothetical protein